MDQARGIQGEGRRGREGEMVNIKLTHLYIADVFVCVYGCEGYVYVDYVCVSLVITYTNSTNPI